MVKERNGEAKLAGAVVRGSELGIPPDLCGWARTVTVMIATERRTAARMVAGRLGILCVCVQEIISFGNITIVCFVDNLRRRRVDVEVVADQKSKWSGLLVVAKSQIAASACVHVRPVLTRGEDSL